MERFSEWATLISTAIAAVSLIMMLINNERENKRVKRQTTLDAYRILQNDAFDFLNKYKPSEIKEICNDIRCTEYKELSECVARIEHFSVGLVQGIYDYDTFYKLAHGYFDGPRGMLYTRLLPLLEQKGIGADIDYYENIHKVWKRMERIT